MIDLNEWFEKHMPAATQEARDELNDLTEDLKQKSYDEGYDEGDKDGETRAQENFIPDDPEPTDLGIVIDYAGRILHNGNHVGWLRMESSDVREFVTALGATMPMWTGEFVKLEEVK